MTSAQMCDTDQTAFRIGPLAVVLIGMVGFAPVVQGFWYVSEFVALHFSNRFGVWIYPGTLTLIVAYLCGVIAGVVLLLRANKKAARPRRSNWPRR
jgi:hypothetical protein